MTGRGLFRSVAPRLERAHAARKRELGWLVDRRRKQRDTILRLEQLVAHRELQLVRAFGRRGTYQAEREEKLREAKRKLKAAEATMRNLKRRGVRVRPS